MDTLLNEALNRLSHPDAESVVEAVHAARLGYEGAISAGSKRTRAIDPTGSQRVNAFLLPLVYEVSEDGIAKPIANREADFAALSVLQGEYAHHTRETGLSSEERAVGYNCVVSLWKGAGTSGNFLSQLYLLRKSYASISDHDPVTLNRFMDIIICCECLLGDPIPEVKKSAAGVSSMFNKRRA